MKAVLVVDMPDNCTWCPVFNFFKSKCGKTGILVPLQEQDERPDWCPLRPLPEKKTEDFTGHLDIAIAGTFYRMGFYGEGWNDCLSEITGETE